MVAKLAAMATFVMWLGRTSLSTRAADHANDLREMRGDSLFDLRPIDRAAQQARERRDAALGNTARHDQIEVVEIGGDVEREPVARDPPRDADADRRQLVAPDPHARESLDARRRRCRSRAAARISTSSRSRT